VDIKVPECGIRGNATIRSIDLCPVIDPGNGYVVTGTFKHYSARILDVHIEGASQPIGTTPNHFFWCEGRNNFVRADTLRIGDELRGVEKPVRISQLQMRPSGAAVYNLEVQVVHVYHVSEAGVLVHNTGPCPVLTPYGGPGGGHHIYSKKAFEGVAGYGVNEALCLSNAEMARLGIDHGLVTGTQQRLFRELALSGRANTMAEHTRIAIESLMAGGASEQTARTIVARALNQMRNRGITAPGATIPWNP
jgi:hypothetical protein